MKLKSAHLNNFRSISDLKLDFEFACQCLIGINESGKSNILRALHLLDPKVEVSPTDLRMERHNEPQVTAGFVRFAFKLDDDELEEIIDAAGEKFAPEFRNYPLVVVGQKIMTLADYCTEPSKFSVSEGLYRVTLPGGERTFPKWARPNTDSLMPGWFRNSSSAPINVSTKSAAVNVPPGAFFFSENRQPESGSYEKIDLKTIADDLHRSVKKIVEQKLPACIFWKYADKYLLPSSIDVASFCANPDSCVPLKSMFELAGYAAADLGTTIAAAQAQGHYRYTQILEKTAARATEHIRSVWSDHKTVRIKLDSHGTTLSPIITDDEVPLDMSNRSDGFKRFVSFLLQISAKVRTAELTGALIIIDEPEIALHPTGAKNLLAELIEIGKSNTVVFSTHSIFMIDKKEIGRHLVVEKKKEVTSTWRAEKSRIQDEEVLYSAIGFSIFEALKEKNVIFEGWRDKQLYVVAAASMAKNNAEVKSRLSEIGSTNADGAKDIRNVARFLELASRPCLIISDADSAALQSRTAYTTPGSWGTWKTLQDVLPGASVLTGEDLLTRAAVVKRANKFRADIAGLDALTEDFFKPNEYTIGGLRRWLQTANLVGTGLDEALNRLKSAMLVDLKATEMSALSEQLVQFVLDYDFAA